MTSTPASASCWAGEGLCLWGSLRHVAGPPCLQDQAWHGCVHSTAFFWTLQPLRTFEHPVDTDSRRPWSKREVVRGEPCGDLWEAAATGDQRLDGVGTSGRNRLPGCCPGSTPICHPQALAVWGFWGEGSGQVK